jgi:uncharacterized protein (DUF779 family)
MCLRAGDLPASPHDVQLGALADVPVVIDSDQNRRWQQPSFHVDVAAGAAGGFSLEALEGCTSAPRRTIPDGDENV